MTKFCHICHALYIPRANAQKYCGPCSNALARERRRVNNAKYRQANRESELKKQRARMRRLRGQDPKGGELTTGDTVKRKRQRAAWIEKLRRLRK